MMKAQKWLRTVIAAGVLSVAGVAAAQQTVSSSDLQRLQDQVYQAGSELGRLRSTDSALASRLENELDDLRDEVVYLKVKLRKDGSVNRTEYADVRDKLQDLRSRAGGDAAQGGGTQLGRPDDRQRGVGSGSGSGSGSGTGVYDDRRSS